MDTELDKDLQARQEARQLVKAAAQAQKALAQMPQESLDAICREIARINRGIFTLHIPAGLIRLMKPNTADFILLSNTARPKVLTDKLGYRFLWEDFGAFLNSL